MRQYRVTLTYECFVDADDEDEAVEEAEQQVLMNGPTDVEVEELGE